MARKRGLRRKSHHSAIVIVPPPDCWAPIQAIRARYDRRFHRWMPHITLLYPFVPKQQIPFLLPMLQSRVASVRPFVVELAEFRYFPHPTGSATVWLRPSPAEAVDRLQAALQEAVPWCDDQRRHRGGFTPHLSVGQVADYQAADELVRQLQSQWTPLKFVVDRVSVITRTEHSPFREQVHLRLGEPTCVWVSP